MTRASAHQAMQFDDPAQQREAAGLGMWTFLITEVLFFGGLFTAYTVYRLKFHADFAQASSHLYLSIATVNTAVLLISSLTVALAVFAAAHDRRRMLLTTLGITIALGAAFLALKGFEYRLDVREHLLPGFGFQYAGPADPAHVRLFMTLYLFMTGVHALHVLIGVGVWCVLLAGAWRRKFTAEWHTPIELAGLYWHFVDIVWIFLLPLLYMITR